MLKIVSRSNQPRSMAVSRMTIVTFRDLVGAILSCHHSSLQSWKRFTVSLTLVWGTREDLGRDSLPADDEVSFVDSDIVSILWR